MLTNLHTTHGETVRIRFVAHVEPSGDPHIDAERQDQADADAILYEVRTLVLPGARWEALVLEHPPLEVGDEINPATFPPALIAESVTGWTITQHDQVVEEGDRAPTVEEAAALWAEWPEWARMELFNTLKAQNVFGVALGKARSKLNAAAAQLRADTTSSA